LYFAKLQLQLHTKENTENLPSHFRGRVGDGVVVCNEASTDLKAFTPQNKRLKIARAICAKQSTNNDNEKINKNIKYHLVMAWIAGIFKCVVLQ
jgi:hypothetical protein